MNAGIFLDRDGVINELLSSRVKFVNKPKDFYLLDGVGQAIRMFNDAGYHVFVVTNQGGIGLGYMKESLLHKVHQKMEDDLAEFSAKIDDIAYCPHKPHANCACRKPKPQMILDLAEKHQVDIQKSYMVGDRTPDIEAGKEAGTKTVLVGNREENQVEADMYFQDLLSFAEWIV
ncbi:D-glycero-alpha-D-manno-heptose-1,7-bisphosphate 7-phosphatase [Oceanobacillus salinisoli]|uniref:D-glycero-alpha-D-manno-heptose-1,7-bisphosphate 7-phosphatase n=1 Tax=Oceanobacillus salinisoli TaxID=2678611 RepID=UPI0012E1D3F6|nr:HAD family hydrolase [Oceanobacillus salinisoli]